MKKAINDLSKGFIEKVLMAEPKGEQDTSSKKTSKGEFYDKLRSAGYEYSNTIADKYLSQMYEEINGISNSNENIDVYKKIFALVSLLQQFQIKVKEE